MPSDVDRDNFVALLLQHEPKIRACVLLWVPNWNDAQDVTQQVNLTLWRRFEQYQEGTNFLAWALTIARNEVKNHRRQATRDQRVFSDEFIDVVGERANTMMAELDRRRGLLKFCMDRLKPAEREVVYLRYECVTPVEAIAKQVGRSVDATYKLLGRLRNALATCVARRMAAVES